MRLEELERRPTSALSEQTLDRGYGLDVETVSTSAPPEWTEPEVDVGYTIGRRLFLPCACGDRIGAAPEEVELRLREHQATTGHRYWRRRMGL